MRLLVAIMAICCSTLAMADQGESFQQGKTLGEGANATTFSGIGSASVSDKIPAYGSSPAEAQLFQGGGGQLSGPGVVKMQTCSTYTPGADKIANQECEAVNFLARNPQIRPQFNITKNDPMVLGAKNARNSAEGFFQSIGINGGTGSSTQCTTKTETTPAQYTTETCSSLRETGTQQCTMGRTVNIDSDANFQCDQTVNAYETVKCRRGASVTCTGGGDGCAPSGINTSSVSISGFGRFLVHPTSDRFWHLSVGTITPTGAWVNNYDFGGNFYNVFESNVYFRITNKGAISTFFLDEILYDDSIVIWLNGNRVFHSRGGTDLVYGCRRTECDWYDDKPYCSTYYDGVWDGNTCSMDPYNGGANISRYGGVELKGLLLEGVNHIRIKVAIGRNGDAIARFKTRAYCPLTCSVFTDNQCAALEVRSQ